jgi:hypothetical protein
MRYKEWQLMFLFCFVKDIYEPSRLIKLSNKKKGMFSRNNIQGVILHNGASPKKGANRHDPARVAAPDRVVQGTTRRI